MYMEPGDIVQNTLTWWRGCTVCFISAVSRVGLLPRYPSIETNPTDCCDNNLECQYT